MWRAAIAVVLLLLMLQMKLGFSDINKDKQECAPALAGLATCLSYVGGQSKAPTPDCCTGLQQVLKDNKKCLCLLIKDRNDPSLGLKINATLALTLPQTCHAPANISECPTILHLAPNDPEAKIFTDFAKAETAAPATTATSPASAGSGKGESAKLSSDGGNSKGNRLLLGTIFCAVFLSSSSMSHRLIFHIF